MTETRTDGDNLRLAVTTILFTVFALSLGDALIKQISADFPLWQIFVLRSAIALPVLATVIRLRERAIPLVPLALGWTALRSAMLVGMWVAYYAALPHVALSLAAAAYYTLPLFTTLLAALLLGERVGTRGWIAVLMGFSGMLIMLRPDTGDFNVYALLPLVSAVLYALAMILTRSKCRGENPLVLSLALNVGFVCVGAVATLAGRAWGTDAGEGFLSGHWVHMGPAQWGAMALLACAILIGSVGAAIAYQAGPSSVVSTFDFAYLAFAVIWGIVFFAEAPDKLTIAGMILIAAGGILAVRR